MSDESSPEPPGPSGLPVIGNTRRLADDRLGFLTECAREYGDVVRIDFVGENALYALFHPDHVREVLVEHNDLYVKGDFFQDRLELLGDGLLNAEGEQWRRQRHEIEPAFHPDRIAGYAETMVAFTERLLDRSAVPETRNVHEDMMALTLEIVADALFAVDIRDDESEIGEALERVMEHARRQSGRPIEIPEWVPIRDNRQYRQARETLDGIVADIVEQRRRGDDAGDVVSMLLQAERPMDTETIRDQVLTLLLAGHETTAQALTFTAYLLATHPEIDRRLQTELDDVLDGDRPTVEDLDALPYLERVVRESMRLYPPVPGIVRQPTTDVEIGGYTIPEGETVVLSQWVVHRDQRSFDNPLAFDPDRWERRGREDRHPFAYFPFSGGPRRCVGDRFALLEARLVLARLLQDVRFETVPETSLDLAPSITLRPADGLDLRVVPRAG
ncbi:MAG: cytochrome P450 [Halapricum sp.]